MDAYNSNAESVTNDAICTACGCLCDDIGLHVRNGAVEKAERACERGKTWLLARPAEKRPEAWIGGKPASLKAAIARAAEILAKARSPLVYGLSHTTVEAQRVAIAIADRIGAVADTPTSSSQGPVGMALDGVGEMTCTLGEMRNRADLIVFWGCDPAVSHPRHFERYSLDAPGMFLPGGRTDRTCVVVDVERTATVARADEFIAVRRGGDFEALWTLRALAKDLPLDAATVEAQTGVALATWAKLVETMRGAKFGAMVYGNGLGTTRGGAMNIEALLALVRDMNAHTRFVANALRGAGNQAGADSVMLWQTGYPFAVNLARGFPRYGPREFSAATLLERREVDAALIVGSDPLTEMSSRAAEALRSIPYVCIDSRDTATMRAAAVAIPTATYGIETAGTVYRMDDVPLPLRPALKSPRVTDADVLSAILSVV